MKTAVILAAIALAVVPAGSAPTNGGMDLLQRYPTTLVAGDTEPERARPWEFTSADIFQLSHFNFKTGKDLDVETGPADVGIGHCKPGAVWAVILPRQNGELASSVTNQPENVSSIWLRFHPARLDDLFPPNTVFTDDATNLISLMRWIAGQKLMSSWHNGYNVMIPEPKDITVDVDTKESLRRFFVVDTEAQTAQYISAFEKRAAKPPPAITLDTAQSAFDQLWKAFDSKYAMFVIRTNVDWAALREQYRPRALAAKSTLDFADTCADMLKSLRDLHVWLTIAGENVPVFNRPRTANSNPSAHRTILESLNDEGNEVEWAVTPDKIGFIAIYGWDDPDIPAECQEALEHMRDTRGLIVDVRLNGGGSEDLAKEFASRFVNQKFIYAYSQYRNGPNHTNLTEKFPREIAPDGPWRYGRPVLVLIGQKCMSSNESFIGMMTGDTNAMTMGDHTCGSSGNPEMVELPLDMTVSVPQWIDYLPDGKTPVDEHGFQPQIPFKPMPGAFNGNRDDLLMAALERLRHVPLPSQPIAGPAFLSDEEWEARDNSRPKVVSVYPTDGAQSVESVINLRIRFDRPMDPMVLKLNWESGGFLDCDFPQYNPRKCEFTVPVRLPHGIAQKIVLNQPYFGLREGRKDFPRDGFQSEDHRLARLFTWEFKTKDAAPVAVAAGPPKIIKISPPPGSVVPYRIFLEVQFDQPMESPDETLPFLVKQQFGMTDPELISRIEYDASSRTFRMPLLLFPNKKSTFTLSGFYSEAGLPSEPVKLEYQVSGRALSGSDQEKFKTQENDPQLLETLKFIQQNRANMTSVSEQAQTLMMMSTPQHDGLYTRMTAQNASFKWQQPGQFYVEAANLMRMDSAFAIGSDCTNCWWLDVLADATNFVVCPANQVRRLDISLCDPFDLLHQTPEQAASAKDLSYVSALKFANVKCRLLEGWGWDEVSPATMTPVGFLTQWWIDNRNGLPLANRVFWQGTMQKTRFLYDAINEPLPSRDFTVPIVDGLSPSPAPPLGHGYTNQFIEVNDGANGNMCVQFGEEGPKGSRSGGFGNFQ